MNFWKTKTSWSNMELGLLKTCVASAYIMIGTYFHKFLRDYFRIFGLIFSISVIWTIYLWIKKKESSIVSFNTNT